MSGKLETMENHARLDSVPCNFLNPKANGTCLIFIGKKC